MNRVMRKPAFEYASSVAVQSGLCQTWSKTPMICFLGMQRFHRLVPGMGVILTILTTCIMNLISTDFMFAMSKKNPVVGFSSQVQNKPGCTIYTAKTKALICVL